MERKPQILIVDDDPHIRQLLGRYLSRECYTLIFGASGVETLSHLRTSEPDVILLDVMMPGMSGFEVCQHLKGSERWQHIPIILITSLDSKEDLARGLEAGADDFLSKPVNQLELRARVRSMVRLKRQFDRLQNMLRLREDLSNMLVHDMRSPLTYIMGFSQLLLDAETMAPEHRHEVGVIYEQARRLNSFINDMLIVAKMEAGQLSLNCTPVNFNDLVRSVETLQAAIAWKNSINLVTELPPIEPPLLSLDVNLFGRVIDNLLSNALKFSPAGTTVTIRVAYPKPLALRLQVLDQGVGVAEEDREHIFNKFEIVQAKHKDAAQVGLGLALCKLVVEAHGGCISVEPNQPVGSIFTIEI